VPGRRRGCGRPARGGHGTRRIERLAGELRCDLDGAVDGAAGAGAAPEAADAAEEALAVYQRTKLLSGEALSLALLGFAAERLGDRSRAEELHTEALAASRRLGDERLVALALEGLAGTAVAVGDHERGGELLGLASHLRDLHGAPSGPASDEVRIGEVILDALGPDRFDEVRRRGHDADIDALVHGPPELDRSEA
jgi:hypothetical protein